MMDQGIGESSNIPMAGAIAHALHDAVGVIRDLPVTADMVFATAILSMMDS